MIRHDLSKPPAYAYLPFRLPKQKEPAIGGLIASIKINCEFLAMVGWQIEGEQSSFGHDGCGGREYAKHLVLATDLLRESRGSCHSRHAFPHISRIIRASLMGPVMSSLPARHTPGSAGVEGHSSFPFARANLSNRAAVATLLPCLAGRLLASLRGQRKAASMMRSEGSGEHYLVTA